MIRTSARPLVIAPPSTHHAAHRHPMLCRVNHQRQHFQIRMSSSSFQTVEHVVLFNVKPSAESTQLAAMVDGLNGLRSMDMVLHLTAGPLLLNSSPSLHFTHFLHSRYRTKEDLANYSASNSHLSVVRSSVLPICDDLLAIDWVAEDLQGPLEVKPGSAMRLKLVKLKEGLGDKEKGKVIKVFGGLKDKVEGIEQLSFGENFSPERAKGFSLASLGVFNGVKELNHWDAVGENEELNKEKDEVRSFVDNLVVVDYVVL
ncbi:hypothetical protein KSS87_003308 [Heliosperma pusillum]|nr:hypothetical protein KSS87_006707 [Heliosperma pusillum]KAH9613236.1 hypothetical protein KSS87_003308 [Heliosperma pusillum]